MALQFMTFFQCFYWLLATSDKFELKFPELSRAIFQNFGYDGWYKLYSICEKNRTLRFALCITMCFRSQQYKLTDSLFSCANICCAHLQGALKRGFKKAYLHEINALFFLKTYYIQVSTFPLSFEDTFERGFAHDTNFFSLYQCIIFSPLIDGHLWHQYVCPLGMERNRIQFAIKMFGRTLLLQQCNL